MQFASALSRNEETLQAAKQVTASLKRQIRGTINLLAVFFTPDHRNQAELLVEYLQRELSPTVLIGCMGEGVVGDDREIEGEPALSVLAGSLPGVTISPFHLGMMDWEETLLEATDSRLRQSVGIEGGREHETRAFILLGDPYTTPVTELMQRLDQVVPNSITMGGMSSGSDGPGDGVLLFQNRVVDQGVVGVRIAGPVRVESIVSQGCRPIGERMLVTKAEENRILALSGQNALEATQKMIRSLTPRDQDLLGDGLCLGIVINEYQDSFGRGDFLVRSVFGAEPNTGAVVVGDRVRVGQTVQYHLRDAQSADEELREMMAEVSKQEAAPIGGFIFTCNGRGLRLFDSPNHDVRSVLEAVPETPLAGFFAQGELGPIGGKSFIHGHTASIVLFRDL